MIIFKQTDKECSCKTIVVEMFIKHSNWMKVVRMFKMFIKHSYWMKVVRMFKMFINIHIEWRLWECSKRKIAENIYKEDSFEDIHSTVLDMVIEKKLTTTYLRTHPVWTRSCPSSSFTLNDKLRIRTLMLLACNCLYQHPGAT